MSTGLVMINSRLIRYHLCKILIIHSCFVQSLYNQIRTTCRGCGHGGCGVLIKLDEESGKISSIVGDPNNPSSKGYICIKAYAATDMNEHPDRLKFPLLKDENGEWKRISWDEALGLLAQKLKTISKESGPEAVAFVRGTGRHYNHVMERFSNLFGTPNRVSNAHMCYIPRGTVSRLLGLRSLPIVDYDSRPSCVMVWGANPLVSNPDEYTSINLENTLKADAKLIVVDPRRTRLAERADVWLQPRPSTDLLVALSMMNLMIKEELYDRNFVENYCENFGALSQHVSKYTSRERRRTELGTIFRYQESGQDVRREQACSHSLGCWHRTECELRWS